MHLKPFHVVLISSAILLGIVLSFWAWKSKALELCVASAAASAILSAYLAIFIQNMKRKGW